MEGCSNHIRGKRDTGFPTANPVYIKARALSSIMTSTA